MKNFLIQMFRLKKSLVSLMVLISLISFSLILFTLNAVAQVKNKPNKTSASPKQTIHQAQSGQQIQSQNLKQSQIPKVDFYQQELINYNQIKTDYVKSYQAEIRFEGMRYLSDVPGSVNLSQSYLLSGKIAGHKDFGSSKFVFDVTAGTFFSTQHSHIVVPELYLTNQKQMNQIYIGRKLMSLSFADHRWQLGMWQPRFAMDSLRPQEQGLTGLFVEIHREKFDFLAFVSPLFIPSLGPDIREKNGALVSNSRWYREPPKEFEFGGRGNQVVYNLDIPQIAHLISNPGYLLSTKIGDFKAGPWVVLSAGYKPVNDLILKRKNYKIIDQDKLDVTVSPDVTHHTIRSVDFGYTRGILQGTVSYIEDLPEVKPATDDWAIQKLAPLKVYSVALDLDGYHLIRDPLKISLAYLKATGGEITDLLSKGQQDDITLFKERLKFKNTASISVEGQLAQISRKSLISKVKYLYDMDQVGSMVNAELLIQERKEIAWLVGADFLGVQQEDRNETDFLNQFRANDRIYGGITYVF